MPRALLSSHNCDKGPGFHPHPWDIDFHAPISYQAQPFLAAVSSGGKEEEMNTVATIPVAGEC